jgi:hypothetical protein
MGRYTAIRVGAMFFSYVADVFLFTISYTVSGSDSELTISKSFLVVRYRIVNPNEITHSMF